MIRSVNPAAIESELEKKRNKIAAILHNYVSSQPVLLLMARICVPPPFFFILHHCSVIPKYSIFRAAAWHLPVRIVPLEFREAPFSEHSHPRREFYREGCYPC